MGQSHRLICGICVYVEPHGPHGAMGPHGAIWALWALFVMPGHLETCGAIWRNMCSHVLYQGKLYIYREIYVIHIYIYIIIFILVKTLQYSWAESLAGRGRWLPTLLAATAPQRAQPSAAASRSPVSCRAGGRDSGALGRSAPSEQAQLNSTGNLCWTSLFVRPLHHLVRKANVGGFLVSTSDRKQMDATCCLGSIIVGILCRLRSD